MKYAIGLDVGIASVGYSVLELDSYDEPYRIVKLGSRIFEKAEVPKTGDPLAAARRGFRLARRVTRRRRRRKEKIRRLIVAEGLLTEEKLATLYNGKELSDVYGLRVKALDQTLTDEEFARVLIHLAQRRGFKSNRKADDEEDKGDGSKMLGAIKRNRDICEEKGYRTVGEMFYHLDPDKRRNRAGTFDRTVSRDAVAAEAHLIFQSQRTYGHAFASEKNEEAYCEILLKQLSFAEGPESGPYAGNQVEKMRGKCIFCPEEERAAKATYSFQIFNLWQHINHIRIIENGDVRTLSDDERRMLFQECHKKAELKYSAIRKLLKLSSEALFKGLSYGKGMPEDIKKAEDKAKLKDLAIYHKFKSVLGGAMELLTPEQLDDIGELLSKNYSDKAIQKLLEKKGFSADIIALVLKIPSVPKNGHLSLKALERIIPHLEQGLTYDKACEAAGFHFQGEEHAKKMFLEALEADDNSITNPVVKRSVSQTIKVINAIVREMGVSPVYLNIELARELSKTLDERNKIEKAQKENAEYNEKMVTELRELGVQQPTGFEIVKYKLWNEQGKVCPYSGTIITFEELMDPRKTEVDHIVPYSRSFDDRMTNKVLVRIEENRNKSNRLPLEYLTGKKRDDFLVWVKNSRLKSNKKTLLLKEKISDEAEWKQRNLQDTQYLSRFLYNYISDHLMFSEYQDKKKKRHVYAVNGMITSIVRARWGIRKVRADGDLHHALDATVIACVTQSMINKINRHAKYQETRFSEEYLVDAVTGEVLEKVSDDSEKFPHPWPWFHDELTIRLCTDDENMRKQLRDKDFPNYDEVDLDQVKAPFVSRMCRHKITGAANKATVFSGKFKDDGYAVSKVKLTDLKWKDGKIEGYYNESDPVLYEILAERLRQFDGNAEKAFAAPVYKPSKKGGQGTPITSVKIRERISSYVNVNGGTGIAANGDMVRVDVFYVENDGYYFVPIYVHTTLQETLPNLAPTTKKDKMGKKVWQSMDDSDFVFSLYPNDLIKVYAKKDFELPLDEKLSKAGSDLPKKQVFSGKDGVFLYYKGLDISTALLNGVLHDGTYYHRSIGKTTLKIEKYEVDVLGNIQRVQKEKRMPFSKKTKRQ